MYEKIFNNSSIPKYRLKTSRKLNPFLNASNIKYKSIAARTKIGKIDVTNILQIWVWGKKSRINQKGKTPKLNHI